MEDWLTTKEAAAYLKVHPKTLYRYVRSGMLRQYQPAGIGRPRFRREDLDALLQGKGKTADKEQERQLTVPSAAGVQSAPLAPPAAVSAPTLLRRRRSGVLPSPLRAEPPPESGSGEAPTIGQDIDAVLKEEGLLEEELKKEYDKLRQSLVSHVRQLAQLIKLAKGEGNETE
jgi:excisionase family DNA binding protein